jgi:putative Ca2+/H+ antiporter (TMEM165/GDT1 family)
MALIVLMGYIMSLTQHKSINLYSGISFLLFGALMMYRAAGDVE